MRQLPDGAERARRTPRLARRAIDRRAHEKIAARRQHRRARDVRDPPQRRHERALPCGHRLDAKARAHVVRTEGAHDRDGRGDAEADADRDEDWPPERGGQQRRREMPRLRILVGVRLRGTASRDRCRGQRHARMKTGGEAVADARRGAMPGPLLHVGLARHDQRGPKHGVNEQSRGDHRQAGPSGGHAQQRRQRARRIGRLAANPRRRPERQSTDENVDDPARHIAGTRGAIRPRLTFAGGPTRPPFGGTPRLPGSSGAAGPHDVATCLHDDRSQRPAHRLRDRQGVAGSPATVNRELSRSAKPSPHAHEAPGIEELLGWTVFD